MKLNLLLLLVISFLSPHIKAQDPIFSQNFMIPTTLNPGFTGFMGTTYAGIIHREQWPDLALKISTDYAFFTSFSENTHSTYGLNLINQRETINNLNYSQINGSYTYQVQLNDSWFFRPALEIGFGLKSFAFQNLLLEDQINIGSPITNPISIDPLLKNDKVVFFDISTGFVLNTEDLWFGLSMKHLNRPNIAFATNGNTALQTLFSLNVGYEFAVADYLDVSFLPYDTKIMLLSNYMMQGRHNRLDLTGSIQFEKLYFGTTAVLNTSNDPKKDILKSINLFTGIKYKNLNFGVSYDFNTAKIGKTSPIYELLLTYEFKLKSCFGCPK